MEGAQQRWREELRRKLEALKSSGLLRSLRPAGGRIDFCSNDYLGLNSSGRLHAMLQEIIAGDAGPVGSCGSRLVRGHYEEFNAAEEAFARFTDHESALLFHSGYAANLGTMQALFSARDRIFCDRLCHASLLDGIRISGARRRYFQHNDFDHLESLLRRKRIPPGGRDWIVIESVYSMDGDRPDLGDAMEIAERHDALLYVDEAHAVGILGPGGAGLVAGAGSSRIAVTVYPCGKAPGLMGAFVCGSVDLRETLINRARSFVFSTAQPPLLARLLADVIALLPTEELELAREKNRVGGVLLRDLLRRNGFETAGGVSHIIPLPVGTEERAVRLEQACLEAGIDVRAIRPPSVPAGGSRLRLTVQAGRSAEEIERLVEALRQADG